MEEEVKTSPRSMTKDVSDLVDTYIQLAKANVTQKAADAASVSVAGIIMAVLGFFFLLFAAVALAWWIGQLISSVVGGFLIIAAGRAAEAPTGPRPTPASAIPRLPSTSPLPSG